LLIYAASVSVLVFQSGVARLSAQASFGTLSLGMPVANVPVPCLVTYCEGLYKSDWVRLGFVEGKIDTIEVIYDGKTMDGRSIGWAPVTLAQAINRHSLSYTQNPKFGDALDQQGNRYGVADFVSGIVYHLKYPEHPTSNSIVTTVMYVKADAPVLADAKVSTSAASTLQLVLAARHVSETSIMPRIIGTIDPRAGIVEAELVNGDLKPARFAKVYAIPADTPVRLKNAEDIKSILTSIAQTLDDTQKKLGPDFGPTIVETICATSLSIIRTQMLQLDKAANEASSNNSGVIATSADEMGEFTLKGMNSGPYVFFALGKVGLNSAVWVADSTSSDSGQKLKLTRPEISCYDPTFQP
jgi:hypothetical protein